jgi:hypothetical protein
MIALFALFIFSLLLKPRPCGAFSFSADKVHSGFSVSAKGILILLDLFPMGHLK